VSSEPAGQPPGASGPGASGAGASGPGASGAGASGELSEEELRAAYEAELNRITSAEVMLQAAVSLLNLGGRRLGLAPGGEGGVKDLDQVRDAIEGVRALLGVLERTVSEELGPLRDALSQLQIAYAREAQAAAQAEKEGAGAPAAQQPDAQGSGEKAGTGAEDAGAGAQDPRRPGPAEASGRLWVPGR
jgi:hypothetical protein